ncbi:MAG: hypothetical protein JWQ71_2512 [Pedosphaera sp.]|nr:hypothetical protein [Pedosphaera sp.]
MATGDYGQRFNLNGIRKVLLLAWSIIAPPMAVLGQTTYTPYAFTTMSSQGSSGSTLFVIQPYDICVDTPTNMYLACYTDYTVRKLSTPDGTNWSITLFAGAANSSGTNDGTGGSARFTYPNSVATDSHGNVFVSDSGNNTIRKITPAGVVTTFAGKAGTSGNLNGSGGAARFNGIVHLAIDRDDNIYAVEYGNNRLRKITPGGAVSTLAIGAPTVAEYGGGACVDAAGNIFLASSTLYTIRKCSPGGVVTTIAGLQGVTGSTDGTNSAARFNVPNDIAVDTYGNLYVTDAGNSTIRRITPDGTNWIVRTIAGSPGLTGTGNGTGSAARFKNPIGIAVDANGKVYVADTPNGIIRAGLPNGVNRWTSGVNGRWEETAKWSAGIPSLGNTANYITNAATKIALIDATTTANFPASLNINNLLLSAPAGSTNYLAMFNTGLATPLKIHERFFIDSGGVVAITNSAIAVDYGLAVGLTNGNAFLNIVGGGVVTDSLGYVGLDDAGLNGVLVSGVGSTWNNQTSLTVGYYSGNTNGVFVEAGASLIVGGTASIGEGCDNNAVIVHNPGSQMTSGSSLKLGVDAGNDNSLIVVDGATVSIGAGGIDIGDGGDNNTVSVSTNSTLTSAGPIRLINGGGPEGNALLISSGGQVVTPQLVVSNGSYVALNGGTLDTGGTTVDNGLPYFVGIGADPATMHLSGGTHSFALGLGITTGAALTGCGNINSYLTVVDAGGRISPDLSCPMSFSGSLSNRGIVTASSTLPVGTNFSQTAAGTLQVVLGGAGAGAYGRLNVSGAAELTGSLSVTFTNGFVPATNNTFTILSAGSRNGTFQNFTYPTNLVGMKLTYTATSVIIEVTNAPPSVIPVMTGSPVIFNGQFGANFSGKPNANYSIEYTDGMSPPNWQTLTNIVASPAGGFGFQDLPAPPSRYYRARYVGN